MSSGNDQTGVQRQWFIQVGGQAYGPFDDKTLWSYMLEGRVGPQSLISHNANMGYRLVSSDPGLMNWVAQAQRQPPQATTAEHATTVFMIMAELKSGRGMNFLQSLQNLGPTQRLGNSVWALQARTTADILCEILSQPLGAEDRLFILDSFANKTAWFNLSPEMDEQIANLWNINR